MNEAAEAAQVAESAAIGMTTEAVAFMVIAFVIVIAVLAFSTYINFKHGGEK